MPRWDEACLIGDLTCLTRRFPVRHALLGRSSVAELHNSGNIRLKSVFTSIAACLTPHPCMHTKIKRLLAF